MWKMQPLALIKRPSAFSQCDVRLVATLVPVAGSMLSHMCTHTSGTTCDTHDYHSNQWPHDPFIPRSVLYSTQKVWVVIRCEFLKRFGHEIRVSPTLQHAGRCTISETPHYVIPPTQLFSPSAACNKPFASQTGVLIYKCSIWDFESVEMLEWGGGAYDAFCCCTQLHSVDSGITRERIGKEAMVDYSRC